MIAKNKQTPATLFLLNKNPLPKNQDERKSARLSFNKKKSSRSITQYQKFNPKEPSLPFQPVTRTNSQIKRLILNKNQFALENLPLQKKFSQLINIFATKSRSSQSPNPQRQKSRDSKSGEVSLLSLRDECKHTRKKSHVRMESMLNHAGEDSQLLLEQTLDKIQKKFKLYEQHSEDWKVRYLTNEGDCLLDEIIMAFKTMIYDVIVQFRNTLIGNVEYCERAVLDIAKEYEAEVAELKLSINQLGHVQDVMQNVFSDLNEKHQKNIVCSMVWEDLQKRGTDIEQLIRQSSVHEKIKKLTLNNPQTTVPNLMSQLKKFNQFNTQFAKEYEGSQSSDNEESRDLVEDENWNDKFQDNERIKGVLKYIHNNKNEKDGYSRNLNSTGVIKQKNSEMKIDNWKSFDKKEKSINNFNKILSQR